MREINRTLYTQATFQHDGSVSINSIVETCIVDSAGAIVGVKQPSHSVNRTLDPKKHKKLIPVLQKLAAQIEAFRDEDAAPVSSPQP